VVADLGTSQGRDAVFAAAPTAEILINNAGFGNVGNFQETDLATSMQMVEVNVAALTDLTGRYLPGMVERGSGRVMNVASTAAFQPGPRMAVYYATKAYVLSFTEAIAQELRDTGVTATAFCPGAFASGFQETAKAETLRLLKGRTLPTSADMAKAALAAMDAGRVVAVPGFVNKVGAISPRFTPRPVVRRISEWVASEA
jgi:short-subunit dehydrogenase